MAISTAVKRVAYHEITPGNITTGDFDAEQYSLFKYGDVQVRRVITIATLLYTLTTQ